MALPLKLIVAGQRAAPVVEVQSTVMVLICAGTVSVNDVPPAALGPLLVRTIVYSIDPPAFTVAGPVFKICKSAAALTPVTEVAESLAEFGSNVPLGTATVAVFEIVPVADASTVPVTVKVTDPLAGSVGMTAETARPATLTLVGHTAPFVAPAQLAETPFNALGTRSLKLAPLAALGPALVTTMLQVNGCNGCTEAAAVLVTKISATGTIVSVTDR